MNYVYNHILIQDLKNLPRTGQTQKEIEDSFKGGLDQLNLSGQIQLLEALQQRAERVLGSMSVLEYQASGLQKAFNLTVDSSKALTLEFDKVGRSLGINTRLAKQYAADMAKYMPGQIKNITANKKYNKELQLTNDFLRNRLGLDAKQAFSIRKIANLQNKSVTEVIRDAEQINKKLIDEEGYAGGIVDILSEMANLNSDIAIQYGRGIPGQLEKSVIAAKKFGLTLGDLNKTAGAMLDIESATTSAVEYQIFTGKKLEGQKYKNVAAAYNQATIEGDSEKQMDIMVDLIKTQGHELKNNFKARESTAKYLGIETSQITDMLSMMEEYNKLGQMNVEQREGESDADFKKRKAKFQEERKGTAVGTDGILDGTDGMSVEEYIKDLISKRSTQSTADKLEDKREVVKSDLVADAGIGLSSADLVAGGEALIETMRKGLKTGIGDMSVKTMKVLGAFEFVKTTAEKLFIATKPLTPQEQEKPNVIGGEKAGDAFVRVNDAILFDPNDKINIMASTSQGSLDKATANMGGGSSNNTSNIGQQVANAIAGMSFVVNNSFNGEDIITQMEIIQENQMNA